jgi:hypothetical protein
LVLGSAFQDLLGQLTLLDGWAWVSTTTPVPEGIIVCNLELLLLLLLLDLAQIIPNVKLSPKIEFLHFLLDLVEVYSIPSDQRLPT